VIAFRGTEPDYRRTCSPTSRRGQQDGRREVASIRDLRQRSRRGRR
jgi:hypothetical protein